MPRRSVGHRREASPNATYGRGAPREVATKWGFSPVSVAEGLVDDSDKWT